MSSKTRTLHLTLAAMFLSLALVLPFLTAQIPELGNALCPMHLPVLLCGFLCGPWMAAAVGFFAPILRFVLFGLPPLMPTGLSMSFELAVYGLVSGLLYLYFPKKKKYVFISLLCAMLAGRIVWGISRVLLLGVGNSAFGWTAFLAGAFLNAIPGIILQLVLIPAVVISLQKATRLPGSIPEETDPKPCSQ